jgi:TRAP-type C4-dicarboxylate transport system permease large subunit
MAGSAASVGYVFLAVFMSGVIVGAIVMVAMAVRKEDRRYSLSGAAPSAATSGVRRLTGFGGTGLRIQSRGRVR